MLFLLKRKTCIFGFVVEDTICIFRCSSIIIFIVSCFIFFFLLAFFRLLALLHLGVGFWDRTPLHYSDRQDGEDRFDFCAFTCSSFCLPCPFVVDSCLGLRRRQDMALALNTCLPPVAWTAATTYCLSSSVIQISGQFPPDHTPATIPLFYALPSPYPHCIVPSLPSISTTYHCPFPSSLFLVSGRQGQWWWDRHGQAGWDRTGTLVPLVYTHTHTHLHTSVYSLFFPCPYTPPHTHYLPLSFSLLSQFPVFVHDFCLFDMVLVVVVVLCLALLRFPCTHCLPWTVNSTTGFCAG